MSRPPQPSICVVHHTTHRTLSTSRNSDARRNSLLKNVSSSVVAVLITEEFNARIEILAQRYPF